jgi:hypothetical protein
VLSADVVHQVGREHLTYFGAEPLTSLGICMGSTIIDRDAEIRTRFTAATFHRYQIADLASLRQAIEMAASPDKRPTPSASEDLGSSAGTHTEGKQPG